MKTIKTKIVMLIIFCAIVSAAVSGGVNLVRTGGLSNQNAGKIMSLQCEINSQEINTTLARVAQSVDTLAQIAERSLTDINKFQTNSKYVEDYTESLRQTALEFANNTEGAMTYYIRYNPEFTNPTSGIFASRNSSEEAFEQLVPTDFSSYDPSDTAHVGWYYIPVQNGKATWMDPYLNANINVYMISYVVPIYVDGVSVGIVGMDIDFGRIENLVDAVKDQNSGEAFIVNSANQIMYHSDMEFGTALSDINGGELSALNDALSNESMAGAEIAYKYGGVQKICYYVPLANGMKFVLASPKAELQAESRELLWIIFSAGIIAVLFSAVVGFFLSNHIASPLKKITKTIKRNAQLNLKQDSELDKFVKLPDETGDIVRAVREMDERLRVIVNQLEETGKTILSNAEQIQASSNVVGEMCSSNSATTQQLAASMEEAAATADNINQNIGTVNDNAREIMTLSENGEQDAKKILERAQSLSHTTNEATERTKTMYEQMQKETEAAIEKSKAVEKINELTQTILQISSQTNMLALNASIEAARAGEAGRGFAVVAGEIGGLATQTQNTVKNIDEIINEVYDAVSSMATCLNSSTEFLEKTVLVDYGEFMQVGEQYAADAGNYKTNMRNITQAVHTLGAAIEQIKEAIDGITIMTGESAQGISQIAGKTTEIAQKMIEEEDMAELNRDNAGKLKDIVGSFILD